LLLTISNIKYRVIKIEYIYVWYTVNIAINLYQLIAIIMTNVHIKITHSDRISIQSGTVIFDKYILTCAHSMIYSEDYKITLCDDNYNCCSAIFNSDELDIAFLVIHGEHTYNCLNIEQLCQLASNNNIDYNYTCDNVVYQTHLLDIVYMFQLHCLFIEQPIYIVKNNSNKICKKSSGSLVYDYDSNVLGMIIMCDIYTMMLVPNYILYNFAKYFLDNIQVYREHFSMIHYAYPVNYGGNIYENNTQNIKSINNLTIDDNGTITCTVDNYISICAYKLQCNVHQCIFNIGYVCTQHNKRIHINTQSLICFDGDVGSREFKKYPMYDIIKVRAREQMYAINDMITICTLSNEYIYSHNREPVQQYLEIICVDVIPNDNDIIIIKNISEKYTTSCDVNIDMNNLYVLRYINGIFVDRIDTVQYMIDDECCLEFDCYDGHSISNIEVNL